jgi:hypothetical protein
VEQQNITRNFVNETRHAVHRNNDSCNHIVQISLFQSAESNTTIPNSFWTSGVVGSYGEITTLDMSAASPTNVTGMFLPNSWGTQVYASQDYLVLATRGHSYSQDDWEESTFLMTFTLGSRAQGHSIGKVPGFLLNQFSMDEWQGHLRVATTIRSKFACVPDNQATTTTTTTTIRQLCNWQMVEDSDNRIQILEISDSSKTMPLKGSIQGLGHEGEEIYSVRFMEGKAFMVTFRRTDPFYTFDLTDHNNPKQLGELKISGFSNYLHPFNQDGSIMIAVGQNADETTGRTTGLQISLFNVTDLTLPTLIDRHDVNDDQGGYSYSSAQYEHKAFRFYQHTKKLIIPAVIYGQSYSDMFDGFKVYNVDTSEITFHFDINHKVETNCWSPSYLEERSLVHGGILTTMKGHVIKAHDIDSKEFQWKTDLNIMC